MGPVTLPTAGTVYVDAQVVIYTVEHHIVFGKRLSPLWISADERRADIVTSELTAMETSIIPLRERNDRLIASYAEFLTRRSIRVMPIDRAVLRRAAELRAQHVTLRTPDAIHLATYHVSRSDFFLTNDFKLRGLHDANVLLVSDLLDSIP